MSTRTTSALLTSGLVLALGCGSSSSTSSTTHADAASDGSKLTPRDAGKDRQNIPDASRDHASFPDATRDHQSVPDARNDSVGDAPGVPDEGPRALTTRALLPTPVNSLLLDPFITYDGSWGHFNAVAPGSDPAATTVCAPLTREIFGASPVGISAPVVFMSPYASTECKVILAPFSGSTEPVNAQVWVSLTDASGNPIAFPSVTDAGVSDGGVAMIDSFVSVALLPNSFPPTSAPPSSYPFVPLPLAPVTFAGRQWGLLGLQIPVAVPQGGWFAIVLMRPTAALYLQAPEIVPTTSAGQVVHGAGVAPSRPMTNVERGAIGAYGRLLKTRPPPRRRAPPRR